MTDHSPAGRVEALPLPIEVLPHRPPFLWIDRVLSCDAHTCVAERDFPQSEAFFAGHFPDYPVVPGVILIEALAQTLAYMALRQRPGALVLMTGIEACRIRRPVRPNSRVRLTAKLVRQKLNLLIAEGSVHCDIEGEPVLMLQATLKGMISAAPSEG